ncbi:SMP-30/gluconolactonase/LRE family protein [Anaerolineales bacterium HSG24]|nr:SMP-30/gluconolactonase/LRE family protein [Anaerolineales bacterium HSG24]
MYCQANSRTKLYMLLMVIGLLVSLLSALPFMNTVYAQEEGDKYIYLPLVLKNYPSTSPESTLTVTPTATGGTTTSTSTPTATSDTTDFTLTSIAVSNGELLDAYKCEEKVDGVEESIPLSWSNVPDSTGSLAVIMHHYPNPDDTSKANSYLLLWGIDPSVTEIAYGGADDGSWFMGANKDGNAVSYTSPCSPSAGSHEYTIILYALSETPSSLPTQSTIDVDYDVLKTAIGTVNVIDTAVLTFNDVTTSTSTSTPTATGDTATLTSTPTSSTTTGVVSPGATVVKLSGDYQFTEGPAVDTEGNVYFTDISANSIYKWSLDGQISTFLEDSGGANGLFFDSTGNLLACQGGNQQLVSIDSEGNVTVLADKYNDASFNQPNDLWVDAKDGVYFSDPIYSSGRAQEGEYVYYLTPKRDNLVRVIDDLVRPNGIIGTADGVTLYVTDHGAGETYRYTIAENGSLTDKTLFVSVGADGMTIDANGNIYLAEDSGVSVYDSSGTLIETIAVPESTKPTNITFGGPDNQTLFITARTSVYTISMQVKGSSPSDTTPTATPSGSVTPSGSATPAATPGGTGMNISQTLSDEAQKNTIAFDALAFLTGDLCSDSFLPPGKVADFSGFQYLRDNDPTEMGHNTDFVTIIAYNILNILDDSQTQQMITLAKGQIDMIDSYAYGRFPLMKGFRRHLEEDVPTGTTGLDKSAVMAYSAQIYEIDGQISYDRAEALGTILRSLTTEQKAKLDALTVLNGVGNWDSTLSDPLEGLSLSKGENVAVMTYASEMYSWYAGSVEADTYFCPERQGTYFGSFYMKDMPAMASGPGISFTIPSDLTAQMGADFLATLNITQSQLVTGLVDIQRDTLNDIVDTREEMSTQLRKFITEETVDEATILSSAGTYGEQDGEIVYNYAVNFAEVDKTLTSEQRARLVEIREEWNTIACSGAFLYSAPLDNMPVISNTDFLFGTETSTPTSTPTATPDATTDFTLTSSAVSNGELLDAYKCEEKVDSVEKSIPLSWSNVPDSTGSLAVIMHHYPNPDDTSNANSYLLLWAIDPSVTEIPHGEADDGDWFMGANKDGAGVSYTSPCSPSTGSHEYTITLYALSETPSSLPTQSTIDVDYDALKTAIGTVNVIDTATLTFNDVTE